MRFYMTPSAVSGKRQKVPSYSCLFSNAITCFLVTTRFWNFNALRLSNVCLARKWQFYIHNLLKFPYPQNEKASNEGADAANRALFKESDTYCKNLLSKIKCLQYGWHIAVSVCVIWMAIGIAIYNFGLKETVDKWYDL